MIVVKNLTMTTDDRPTQWKGATAEGNIYIRYRRGELSAYVTDVNGIEMLVFEMQIGGKYDGKLSTLEMMGKLSEIFHFIEIA